MNGAGLAAANIPTGKEVEFLEFMVQYRVNPKGGCMNKKVDRLASLLERPYSVAGFEIESERSLQLLESGNFEEYLQYGERVLRRIKKHFIPIHSKREMMRYMVSLHIKGSSPYTTPELYGEHVWIHERAHQAVWTEAGVPAEIGVYVHDNYIVRGLCVWSPDAIRKVFGSDYITFMYVLGAEKMAPDRVGVGYASETNMGKYLQKLAKEKWAEKSKK